MNSIKLLTDKDMARKFIETNHYSHKIPQAIKYRFGMYCDGTLLGIAIFSIPSNQYGVTSVFSDVTQHIGIELSRVYTVDDTPKNFESDCLAQVFRYLKTNSPYLVVISYADPNFGHVGYLYQALNGIYLGKTSSEVRYISPEGALITRRGLGRSIGDTEAKHRERLLSVGYKKVNMIGKHKYLFYICNKRDRRDLESKRKSASISYPKL